MRPPLPIILLSAVALLAVGCGEPTASTTSTTVEPTSTATATGEQTSPRGPRAATTDDVDSKPVITVPDQSARQLIATDV
ncbi:MAG: hypothetical protein H0U42_01535, partial [Thermoleophilaceae bacterium]|nr:hypothetical protein [Thermoleophilaceae bacterium]